MNCEAADDGIKSLMNLESLTLAHPWRLFFQMSLLDFALRHVSKTKRNVLPI